MEFSIVPDLLARGWEYISSMNLITLAIALLLFNEAIDAYLSVRQHRRWKRGQKQGVPEVFQGIIAEEKYQESLKYHLERSVFGFLETAVSAVVSVTLLRIRFMRTAWGWSEAAVSLVRLPVHHIPVSLVFVVIVSELGSLFDLPFTLYSTFRIEARWGFNKTTPRTFILDQAKARAVQYSLLLPVLAAGLAIIGALPDNFWLPLWLLSAAVSLGLQLIMVPVLIPIFNTLTPLPSSRTELGEKLETLAEAAGLSLKKVRVMDGSRRSTKANAMLTGLFSRKSVLLYDTLLDGMNDDAVAAVVGHELGHSRHYHVPKLLVSGLIKALALLYLANRCYLSERLYTDLGFTTHPPLVGLYAFTLLLEPLMVILGIVDSVFSRRFEYQADRYAVRTMGLDSLGAALVELTRNNLSDIDPDPVVDFITSSHPCLAARLRAMERLGVDRARFRPEVARRTGAEEKEKENRKDE